MAAEPSANDNHNEESARPIQIVAGKPIVVLSGDMGNSWPRLWCPEGFAEGFALFSNGEVESNHI